MSKKQLSLSYKEMLTIKHSLQDTIYANESLKTDIENCCFPGSVTLEDYQQLEKDLVYDKNLLVKFDCIIEEYRKKNHIGG
jgi:hypothetical protein